MRVDHPGRRERRRANYTVEAVLLLPILAGFVFAVVEFGMMVSYQQRLAAAARDAARVVATGGTKEEVEETIRRHLGGLAKRAVVQIIPEDLDTLSTGDPVAVRVELDAGLVVPDMLALLGVSIRGQRLLGQAVMRYE